MSYHFLFHDYEHEERMTRCQCCGFHHEFCLCLGQREFLLTKTLWQWTCQQNQNRAKIFSYGQGLAVKLKLRKPWTTVKQMQRICFIFNKTYGYRHIILNDIHQDFDCKDWTVFHVCPSWNYYHGQHFFVTVIETDVCDVCWLTLLQPAYLKIIHPQYRDTRVIINFRILSQSVGMKAIKIICFTRSNWT